MIQEEKGQAMNGVEVVQLRAEIKDIKESIAGIQIKQGSADYSPF
jgi:hypothetical protein